MWQRGRFMSISSDVQFSEGACNHANPAAIVRHDRLGPINVRVGGGGIEVLRS